MVSRAELRESRQALSRMLADFSSSQAGYELIIERLKEQSSHLFGGSKDKISSTGSATTSNSSTVMTPAQQKVVADAKNNMNGKNIDEAIRSLDPTEAQAMDALMNLYEKELQTPMRGLLFGSLMTAMLIQVLQKLLIPVMTSFFISH